MRKLDRSAILKLGIVALAVYLLLAVTFVWPPAGMLYVGRSLYSCAACLKELETVKQEYAHERNLEDGYTVTLLDLEQFCRCTVHKCPGGGVYRINTIGEKPTCSLAGTPGPKPKKKLVWIIGWHWEVPPSGPHQL